MAMVAAARPSSARSDLVDEELSWVRAARLLGFRALTPHSALSTVDDDNATTASMDAIKAFAKKQVEFYFCDANLPRDKFLLSEANKDADKPGEGQGCTQPPPLPIACQLLQPPQQA